MKILFIGHAGVLIESFGIYLAIDPFISGSFEFKNKIEHYLGNSPWIEQNQDDSKMNIGKSKFVKEFGPLLDGILITHEHEDHFDKKGLKLLMESNPNIKIFCPKVLVRQIKKISKRNPIISVNKKKRYRIDSGNHSIIIKILPNPGDHSLIFPSKVGYAISNEKGLEFAHLGDSHGVGKWDNIRKTATDIALWGVKERLEMIEFFLKKTNSLKSPIESKLKRIWWIHWEKFDPGNFLCDINPEVLTSEAKKKFQEINLQFHRITYDGWKELFMD